MAFSFLKQFLVIFAVDLSIKGDTDVIVMVTDITHSSRYYLTYQSCGCQQYDDRASVVESEDVVVDAG